MDERPLPPVDVIVTVFDESRTIENKIANLRALDYPADRLRFVIVDGGSSDGTTVPVERWAARDGRVTLLTTGVADKTAQLNIALRAITADWVLVTDADGIVPAPALRDMVDEALRRPDVSVVGTMAAPLRGHPLEALHWRISNRIRRWERWFGTAGLVVATCYLFRRRLLDRFPGDCVADDVYVACRAAATGSRVALVNVTVHEARAPSSVREFMRHKLRRTLGYLREVLRFMPVAVQMPSPMREVFAWRAVALLGGPIVALTVFAVSLAAVLAASVSQLAAAGILVTIGGAAAGRRIVRGGAVLMLFSVLTVSMMSLALLSYPFVRQTACYRRIGSS